MTNFEFSDNRKTLIVTSEGGRKYNLYFHKYGISMGRGFDGDGGTIYESLHVDFTQIPEEIRVTVMWAYVEAAIAAVDEVLIAELKSDDTSVESIEFIKSYSIGIGRYSKMADLVRQYLEERSKTF